MQMNAENIFHHNPRQDEKDPFWMTFKFTSGHSEGIFLNATMIPERTGVHTEENGSCGSAFLPTSSIRINPRQEEEDPYWVTFKFTSGHSAGIFLNVTKKPRAVAATSRTKISPADLSFCRLHP
jgi:hypothetical protein